MKTVVHVRSQRYLALTENWIYEQIRHLRRYRPVVYTYRRANADLFPTQGVRALQEEYGRLGLFLNRVSFRLFGYCYSYERWLGQDRPNLVHAHFGHEAFALLKLKSKFGFPLVTTFYGYDLTGIPHDDPRWRSNYRQLFEQGECFLIEGNHMKGSLADLGCPEAKIVVQHIGVDVAKIRFEPRTGDDSQAVRVLFAARFTEKKGAPYAVEAFARVKQAHPELPLQLTILGDSNGSAADDAEKRRILDAVERHHLGESVQMLGYQPHATMLEVALTHHIFVAPSVHAANGDTEGGAPVSVIEMSASGMPVLATRHCDIPEVVVDGKSGFLVPEKDTAALAERMEHMVLNPGLWESMGRYGREHIEAEYNVETQVQRLEDIYDEVLGDRSPGTQGS
jgi:colanic acid/amylovoran biosynthesis glycosyltransferase